MNKNVKLLYKLLKEYDTEITRLEEKQKELSSSETYAKSEKISWIRKEYEDTQARIIQAYDFYVKLQTLIIEHETSC